MYTLVIFLIQKLIWNKIEYEFLKIENSQPKLTIYNGIKQKKPQKLIYYHVVWVDFFQKF